MLGAESGAKTSGGDASRSVAMHWLTRALQTARIPSAAALQIPARASADEAWQTAAATCGLEMPALARVIADRYRAKVADLEGIEKSVLRLVPGDVAREHQIVPLRESYHHLVIAVADPTNLFAEEAAAFASGRMVKFEIAPPDQIRRKIDALYTPNKAVDRLLSAAMQEGEGVRVVEETLDDQVSRSDVESEPVIRLTNLLFLKAIEQGASDIHIQPERDGGVVRFRVDGVLRRHMTMPLPALVRVISRIKVVARMDIADRLRPQDGRARIRAQSGLYDLRVSTVPTRDAEKAVIRILDQGRSIEGLEETGMAIREVHRLRTLLKGRDGIVIVTGPTGSGKTTTLYSALQELSTDEVNIMTVEDPIEYELSGVTQIQVDSRRKVTFASTLRAILRQDPDIILVGEIRDLETAEVAVQAAMTGHLVLATLHTNDAVSSVQRLLDIGLDRTAVAGSLRGALAQRLVRCVCTECQGNDTECTSCGGSGYRSRAPVTELFTVDDEVQRMILAGTSLVDLEQYAIEHGDMRTMQAAGMELVNAGKTTEMELERVLGECADRQNATPLTASAEAPEVSSPAPSSGSISPSLVATGEDASAASTTEGPPTGVKVLVVDDDGMNRMLARRLLEKEGYAVDEAKDGLEALTLLQTEHDFALLLLDLDMPELGGRDVLKAVRSSVQTSTMPVIILTGTEDETLEHQLMDEGADDYIRKPIDPVRLVSRLRAALRRTAA